MLHLPLKCKCCYKFWKSETRNVRINHATKLLPEQSFIPNPLLTLTSFAVHKLTASLKQALLSNSLNNTKNNLGELQHLTTIFQKTSETKAFISKNMSYFWLLNDESPKSSNAKMLTTFTNSIKSLAMDKPNNVVFTTTTLTRNFPLH